MDANESRPVDLLHILSQYLDKVYTYSYKFEKYLAFMLFLLCDCGHLFLIHGALHWTNQRTGKEWITVM